MLKIWPDKFGRYIGVTFFLLVTYFWRAKITCYFDSNAKFAQFDEKEWTSLKHYTNCPNFWKMPKIRRLIFQFFKTLIYNKLTCILVNWLILHTAWFTLCGYNLKYAKTAIFDANIMLLPPKKGEEFSSIHQVKMAALVQAMIMPSALWRMNQTGLGETSFSF